MKALTSSNDGGADVAPAAARQARPIHAGNLSGETQGEAFSMAEARRIVADLFVHRPAVYWTDFLLTTAVGYVAAGAYFFVPLGSVATLLCFVVAGFAMFRAATFIHEIVHMRQGLMTGFRITWNVLFGVPMLTPSLLYSNHLDHHRRHHYGTAADGEYQPYARRPPGRLARYFGEVLLLPPFAFARFLILGPLSYLHPPLRRWTLERFSSYVCNFTYRRVLPPSEPLGLWLVIDAACFVSAAVLVGSVALGPFSGMLLVRIYLLAVFTVELNWLRNLAAHRFRNEGGELSIVGQLLDSVTVVGHPIWTELFFPLGLRYHALHHLFPSLPYHALPEAHRRLMAQLPADSPYHRTIEPTFRSALRRLWAEARTRETKNSP